MSNGTWYEDAISRLATQSDVVGRLAQDAGGFAAVVAAFEAKDPNAFSWTLERLEMLPHCELICEWVRTKIGVLRCREVCGPPREGVETPDLQQFARAVVRLAADERVLRRVVDAVSCGNGDDYRAAIAELDLSDFCYLLCNWVYSIIYRRVCEVVCAPRPVPLPDPVTDIRAAAGVLRRVIANEQAFEAIGNAAVALDCERLQSAINDSGFVSECEIICWVICIWRCVWVCRELCELPTPVLTGAYGIEEARNFALAARQLASQPRALGDLVNAVQSRNATAYGEIIARFGLGPYCLQVCAWVCSETCSEFCTCVCPRVHPPLFTQVGNFEIYGEIDPSTGLTSTQLPLTPAMPYGGGPNFAFFEQLQLGGFCPIYSPTSPGTQMQYRFLYATVTTTLAAAISSSQLFITVASSTGAPSTPSFNVSVCHTEGAVETAEIMTVTGVSGTTWTVTRGVDGTTPAAAPAGATVGISPAPINGSLVSPVQIGTRPYPGSWPDPVTRAPVPGYLQAVWIKPPAPSPPNPPFTAPADPSPPTSTETWYPPIHNITPDANGWVPVDVTLVAGSVTILLGFDTTQPGVVPGGCSLPTGPCIGAPGGAPAGTAVPPASQGAGTDLSIIFQATRVTATTVDYSNSLCRIHVNNWSEVNNLWFYEFTTGDAGCCTPIDETLSVQFTVDHEEMAAGAWSLGITSCSPSAPPGAIASSTAPAPPGATVTPRGGWGTIVEPTGGVATTLANAVSASDTSITVMSSAGFPSTPFNAFLCDTREAVTVTAVSATTWTVTRGANGTTPAAAPAGATLTTAWCDCAYIVTLSTRPGLTTGIGDRTTIDNQLPFCICAH